MTIKGKSKALNTDACGKEVDTGEQNFVAIPYYARCNKGNGEMRIWLPQKIVNLDLLGYKFYLFRVGT